MHMDKPLGVDQEGYRRMSNICKARGIPLQVGYTFRSNEAINSICGKRDVPCLLARIIRGEIPNPPGLYRHNLLVHKVSLDACNLKTEEVR